MKKRLFAVVLTMLMLLSTISAAGAGKSADAAGKTANVAGRAANEAGKSADETGKSADCQTTQNWVSAWSTSPVSASLSDLGILDLSGVLSKDVSSRVTVIPAASGSKVRLIFSNEYGLTRLRITACTVAETGSTAKQIDLKTVKNVTFAGKKNVTIPAGGVITSDPVEMRVTAEKKLAVTTYFHGFNVQRTIGLIGGETYVAIGNYTRKANMKVGIPLSLTLDSGAYEVIPSLKGIEVLAEPGTANCVIFGDSTVANEIPRLLEARLQAEGITNISVTQQAIKGNRLLAEGVGAAAKLLGESGTERFERDVLGQAGVKYVVVKLGTNDIIHPHCKSKADELTPVTFEQMCAGYEQLVEMAHSRGIKIYFTDIAPWKGYTRDLLGTGADVEWSPEIDAVRLQLNAWFAGEDCPADGFIDTSCLRDPADENALLPAYTTDGAHMTEAGQQAFAAAFPVDIFR